MDLVQLSIRALLCLNALEGPRRAKWTHKLSAGELGKARQDARKGVPTYVLGHHDRLIARGKPSIGVVAHGVCSACHMKLPIGHHRRGSQDMDVCDHCGVFLVWEVEAEVLHTEPDRKAGKTAARTRTAAKPRKSVTKRRTAL